MNMFRSVAFIEIKYPNVFRDYSVFFKALNNYLKTKTTQLPLNLGIRRPSLSILLGFQRTTTLLDG
jgi:hypothetical protein